MYRIYFAIWMQYKWQPVCLAPVTFWAMSSPMKEIWLYIYHHLKMNMVIYVGFILFITFFQRFVSDNIIGSPNKSVIFDYYHLVFFGSFNRTGTAKAFGVIQIN